MSGPRSRAETSGFRVALVSCLALTLTTPFAAVDPGGSGRFDHLTKTRDGGVIGVKPAALSSLPATDNLRQSWDRFLSQIGGSWRVWIDGRSSLPALATGSGLVWISDPPDLEALARRAEDFLGEHAKVLGDHGAQLVLDRESSGPRGASVWLVRFRQFVDGVPVEGSRYDFHISHGNLVAFGASRLAPVRIDTTPSLTASEARAKLDSFVRATAHDGIRDLATPELLLVPLDTDGSTATAWNGLRGEGYGHRLIWRFRFTDLDEIATWTGEVDAHTGEIFAFYDDTRYGRIKGHVNPISDDGFCAIGGCPEPDYPLPFTDYTEDGGSVQYANQHGLYQCGSPGSTIETTLDGQYFLISDQCGTVSATTTCDDELDLGVADDINCGVAAGASAGNTDAARSAYYTLNAINRKARFWLPGITWLQGQVECRTNVPGACNASWNGSINMQWSAGGCGNTGQLQGLVTHEWGHGLDNNDGGGGDNSGEGYADVVAIFEGRESCIARGFHIGETCTGYGDTCLTCTGLREMDWDARQSHMPATPTGYLSAFCGGGGGPCGKAIHCESHLISEVMFDLAARDLPAMGIDPDTAWQLLERLWYQSRPGSGGDMYNCTLPDSDSCGIGTWYHQLRLQDDDDGNLANGTPHAAAIFAAFDRHDIACGGAGDSENQNSSSCPALDAPLVSFTAQTNAVDLDWDPVASADGYRVYRNENGCSRAQFPVVETDAATTGYLDTGLANGFPVFYRVQAIGSNTACESPVSDCIEAAAQQTAGRLSFDRSVYGCSHEIVLEVTDLNHPSASMTVTIESDTETSPETVVLNETSVGSARFTGTIFTTTAAPSADGLLSVGHDDAITAEYIDQDDGEGGIGVPQQSVALADCLAPEHTSILVTGLTDNSATLEWTTSKSTTGFAEWGTTPALGNVVPSALPAITHSVPIEPLAACSRIYFRIVSTDEVGYSAVADVQGAPFEFNVSMLQGVLHAEGFETDTGWTLEGDWEIGPPQGLGTAPGDPTVAGEGSQVLGMDLSGLGAWIGDYEFNRTESATSGVIDASTATAVELRLLRWLNYSNDGSVQIEVRDSGGVWQTAWTSTSGVTESAWSERVHDITAQAAGNAAVQVRFVQSSRFIAAAGWNVDHMVLRDSSLPPYGACGGCGGAPTLAGVGSVSDDSCVTAGLTVSWAEAPAWGTGNSGTYSVYRDTAADFTPGAANRVATGLSGTSWTDTTAPSGVMVYYLVRAENDETCGTGPNNGGVTDANLIYAGAIDVTGETPPDPVGNTLFVDRVNLTDVRLDWTAVSNAASYNVYRSTMADTGFAVVGQPALSFHEDPGALDDGQSYYYLITALNACGAESTD